MSADAQAAFASALAGRYAFVRRLGEGGMAPGTTPAAVEAN